MYLQVHPVVSIRETEFVELLTAVLLVLCFNCAGRAMNIQNIVCLTILPKGKINKK